ncbi:MAG TPA: hypothetical protein VM263_12705 [Acidimicrobiales bacterium]|nr:hypothetical protein [Acidimicrobiales bacterium]
MSDATVVSGQAGTAGEAGNGEAGTGDHGAGDHGTADEGRPSFLPPPTFPADMLLDGDDGADGDDGGGDGAQERAPVAHRAPPEDAPARPSLLIRLGHRLCGFR